MKNNESKLRIKIIAGYLLLIATVLSAVFYIYGQIYPVVNKNNDTQELTRQKIVITGTTITTLYQANSYANLFVQTPSTRNINLYRQAVDSVFKCIDSLQVLNLSEHQKELLQQITTLLKRKESNIINLVRSIQANKEDALLRKSLEELENRKSTSFPQDSVAIKTETETQITIDTTRIAPTKRSVWRRIAEVFSPQDSDIVTQINTTVISKTDTLPIVSNTQDSITQAMQQILEGIITTRNEGYETINRRQRALMMTDQEISNLVVVLLNELNEENLNIALTELSERQHALHRASNALIIVLTLALCIIIFFLIMIFKDISKSQHYKRQLEMARKQAEDLMESRQRLLLSVSHDIRAPLSAIMGYVELLAESPKQEKVKEYTTAMKFSSDHLMELLTNLLEYSRLETGKAIEDISIFKIRPLFEEAVTMFLPTTQKKGIALSLESDIPENCYIQSDSLHIRQILINLVSNAAKFTDKGSIRITASLKDTKEEKQKLLVFSVTDTGCGIPEDKQQNIFEEFSRADSAGKEGSGFGLSVVSRLTALLGGSITLDSLPGKGSSFTITLPATIPAPEELPAVQTQKYSTAPANILVIEDDSSQRAMITEMLRLSGHRVYYCEHLAQCLEIIETNDISLILTDIQAGEFSGYQLLETVRTAQNAKIQQLPVIAVSASGNIQTHKSDYNFTAILKKPFTKAQLLSVINQQEPADGDMPQQPFSLDTLLSMMDNDREAVAEIVNVFITTTQENLAQLSDMLSRKDYEGIKKTAHRMLPMFIQLNITEIGEKLKILETTNLFSANRKQLDALVKEIIDKTPAILDTLNNN
ncbi:MAG TPA: response regulator [Candidatus Avirikenella pullistercoris]|nr:response regulator [Candidatus Avirikenella pullistercoris]